MLNSAVSVKPPLYSAVLELDTVVRKHAIPQHTDISVYEGEGVSVPEVTSRAGIMLRFAAYTMKEIGESCVFFCVSKRGFVKFMLRTALLYLHRSHFASAVTDFTGDPLQTPFSKSVVTSFACACAVISKIGLLFEREPQLSVRIWLFW